MYTDPEKLAKHIFENLFPGFSKTVKHGDVLCSTSTFGIGSSREQAVSSLLSAGVVMVIAPAFGRIFFRNSWNLGLIAIETKNLNVHEKERIDVDLYNGEIITDGSIARFSPPPASMLKMVMNGGLLPMLAERTSKVIIRSEKI